MLLSSNRRARNQGGPKGTLPESTVYDTDGLVVQEPVQVANHGEQMPGIGSPRYQEGETAPKVAQTTDTMAEFDGYGTELHKDAKVWKVYVKETDKYDADLVKRWNDSTDVILIFVSMFALLPVNYRVEYVAQSALFSAIATAFLVESSKLLRPDPVDETNQTLRSISQTLLGALNSTAPVSGFTSPPANEATDFTPSSTAVCVNSLWFLSLSLSLATAFIAIISKDWCQSFMNGRTGHPYLQTCRRQRKWDMIELWKMPELLMFLPSLIHLALLLFSVGLCMYLWDTHATVALPVICVSGIAFGFYLCSSVAGIIFDFFPYPTIMSRLARSKAARLLNRLVYEMLLFVGLLLVWSVIVPIWIVHAICYATGHLDGPLDRWTHKLGQTQPWAPQNILSIIILKLVRFIVWFPAKTLSDLLDRSLDPTIDAVVSWSTHRFPTLAQGLELILSMRHAKIKLRGASHRAGQDRVLSLALSWLIRYCEVPQSVDAALQAIAGATKRIPREPLLECQAALEILRRLASSSLYTYSAAKTEYIISLYSRALTFLGTSGSSSSDTIQSRIDGELEMLLWELQVVTEKGVAALIEDGDFELTKGNLAALRIGSTTASSGLKILKNDMQNTDLEADRIFSSIAELLDSHMKSRDTLHKAALLSLIHAAILFSLIAPHESAASAIPMLCLELVAPRDSHSANKSMNCAIVESLAVTCVLLYNKYTNSCRPDRIKEASWRGDVARELIERYSQDEWVLLLITKFGLQELTANPSAYAAGYTPPPGSYAGVQESEIASTLAYKPSKIPLLRTNSVMLQEDTFLPYLQALDTVYHSTPVGTPEPHVYLFALEVLCRLPNKPSPALSICTRLMSQWRFPTLSEGFIRVLERRGIVGLLRTTSTSAGSVGIFFASGQLWLLLSLCLHSNPDLSKYQTALKAELNEPRANDVQHRELGEQIESIWDIWHYYYNSVDITGNLKVWAFRLMECVFQSRNHPVPSQVLDGLHNVPPELRGLSSFTAWELEPAEGPMLDKQAVRARSINLFGVATYGQQADNGGKDAPDAGATPKEAETRDVEFGGGEKERNQDAVASEGGVNISATQVPEDLGRGKESTKSQNKLATGIGKSNTIEIEELGAGDENNSRRDGGPSGDVGASMEREGHVSIDVLERRPSN